MLPGPLHLSRSFRRSPSTAAAAALTRSLTLEEGMLLKNVTPAALLAVLISVPIAGQSAGDALAAASKAMGVDT